MKEKAFLMAQAYDFFLSDVIIKNKTNKPFVTSILYIKKNFLALHRFGR